MFTKKVLAVVLEVSAIVVGVIAYVDHSTAAFKDAYGTYAQYADDQEIDAYVPGAADNPTRQQLNKVLTEILMGKLSDTKRLDDARTGLALINEARQQIDVIGDRGGPVDQAIGGMESNLNPLDQFVTHGKVADIVTLAKKRADIVSDVRAYSYSADAETTNIFDQIISDKGKLTPAYIKNLNDKVPDLENQFDQRSNLYVDLQNVSNSIHADAKSLGW